MKKINKMIGSFTAKFAALVLACSCFGTVWGATPVAEWAPGDFPVSASGAAAVTSTKGSLTITKNDALNTSTKGYILIAPASVGDGWPAYVTGGDLGNVTVVVGYTLDSDKDGSIIAFDNQNGSGRFHLNVVNSAFNAGYTNNNSSWKDLSASYPTDSDVHYAVFAYGKSSGAVFYLDGTKNSADCSGLKESDYNITRICLGGHGTKNNPLNGAKFHYVAVYNSKLNDQAALTAYNTAVEKVNRRKIEVTADATFDGSTGVKDFAGEAATWNDGADLYVTVPSTAANTVTLELPVGGLNAGSLLKFDVAEGKKLVLSGSLAATDIVVTGDGNVDFTSATVVSGTTSSDLTLTLTSDTTFSTAGIGTWFNSANSILNIVNTSGSAKKLKIDDTLFNAGTINITGNSDITLEFANGVTYTANNFSKTSTGSLYVTIDSGATVDVNGKTGFSLSVDKFILAGGALENRGLDLGTNIAQMKAIELTADSSIGGTKKFGLVASQYAPTTLTLNGHKLTIDTTAWFILASTTVADDNGTIQLDGGVLCRPRRIPWPARSR